jgi:hypothetical protein
MLFWRGGERDGGEQVRRGLEMVTLRLEGGVQAEVCGCGARGQV